MNLNKLFGVLVMGGSLLVASACESDEGDGEREPLVSAPDAAAAGVDASPGQVSDAAALDPCFCDTQACCSRDEQGVGTVQEGFECCWSTTC